MLAAGGPAPGGCGHPGGGAGSEPCTGVTSIQVAGSGVRNVPGPLTASLWSREHSATWGPGVPWGCLPCKGSLRSCRTATLLESRQGHRILQMRKCQCYGQPGRGGFRWQLVRLVGRVASEQWVPTPSWAQVINLPPCRLQVLLRLVQAWEPRFFSQVWYQALTSPRGLRADREPPACQLRCVAVSRQPPSLISVGHFRALILEWARGPLLSPAPATLSLSPRQL